MTILKQLTATKYGRSSHFYQTPDGDVIPSVTSILSVIGKPALIHWAASTEREMVSHAAADLYEDLPLATKKAERMSRPAYLATLTTRIGKTKAHQKEVAKASEIGSQAHKRVEWLIRKELGQVVGPEPRTSEKALWASLVYEDWRTTAQFTPRAAEQMVWHPQRKYAGTMDLWGEGTLPGIGFGIIVGDIKTSKAIYGEALLQVTAYIRALIAMGHASPPVTGMILRLPKLESDPAPEIRIIPWGEQEAHYQTFLATKALWHWQQAQDAEYEAKKNGNTPSAAQPSLTPALTASLEAVVAELRPAYERGGTP